MSVEGTVPSATPAARRALGCLIAAALCAACGGEPRPFIVISESAPGNARVAFVTAERCDDGWCEHLWVGATADNATRLAALPQQVERSSEIAWTRDGGRVAFLINGQQLRVYDASSLAPAGQVDLVPADGQPPTRVARGVTFSDNGAAITFDDCPRDRSGCKPGLVAVR